jgi:hypothetical protein
MLGLAAALAAGSAGGVVDAGERRDGDYPAAAVQNFLNGNGLNHLPSAAFEHSTPTVLKNLNKDARGSKGDNRHDAPGGTSPQ